MSGFRKMTGTDDCGDAKAGIAKLRKNYRPGSMTPELARIILRQMADSWRPRMDEIYTIDGSDSDMGKPLRDWTVVDFRLSGDNLMVAVGDALDVLGYQRLGDLGPVRP